MVKTSGPAKSLLQNLKFSLPDGWKAQFLESPQQWKLQKNLPPDFPEVLMWSLSPEQAPRNLRDFVNTLETSSTLTQGTRVMIRAREQARFGDGYYAAGTFRLRGSRDGKDMGFAMIRHVGGQTLLFECYRINDVNVRQEALEFCKNAHF
jgi:hypothetical protein